MGLGDITYSCNVISPSDTGGVMRYSKLSKKYPLLFPKRKKVVKVRGLSWSDRRFLKRLGR